MTEIAAAPEGVAVNPFLPLDVYIPDGEPHVFGDRVYLFGSHDDENGDTYCALDYEFYSAPVDDLSTWTSRGVSYRATQDPQYALGRRYLYAPDVVQGRDGRFYLYYCMAAEGGRRGYWGPISVAVGDQPDGPYEYLGVVRNPDGSTFDEHVLFDPAVIDDDGRFRLYYGMCYPFEDMPLARLAAPLHRRVQAGMFHKSVAEIARHDSVQGAMTVELADDMVTVTSTPRRIIPTRTKGTDFAGHAFWEGSSIRRIGDTYYFVYSSFNSHELCYATSAHPDRDFVFRGTIISGGDIGYQGRRPKDRVNHTATNHGGIEQIAGRWYVFYHRNTHGLIHRRQACAEEIVILPDGTIPQVPVTTSGLNGGALPASGRYPAVLCATLSDGRMPHVRARRRMPIITHDDRDRYVGGIASGTRISWRTFAFDGTTTLTIRTRGTGTGSFRVRIGDRHTLLRVAPSSGWRSDAVQLDAHGDHPLVLEYVGRGAVDLLDVTLT